MRKSCAFTGHRQIKNSHKNRIGELLSRAVAFAYSEGCRDFYAGGAIGFDTLAAREVIRFRISHPDVRLIMLLPCINQGAHWSSSQIGSYEYILSEADELKYISNEYTSTCMRERNAALADAADIMIAYVGRRGSGSSQTAGMAERMGKQVYNLYPSLENS